MVTGESLKQIMELGMLRQEDCKFGANMGSMARPCLKATTKQASATYSTGKGSQGC